MIYLGCQSDMWEWRPQLRNRLLHIGLWACLWGILLISNCCKSPHAIVGGTIPGQVVLGYIGKVTDWKPGNKPEISIPPWFGVQPSSLSSSPGFPQWWTVTYNLKQMISSPDCYWSFCFSQQQQKTRILLLKAEYLFLGNPTAICDSSSYYCFHLAPQSTVLTAEGDTVLVTCITLIEVELEPCLEIRRFTVSVTTLMSSLFCCPWQQNLKAFFIPYFHFLKPHRFSRTFYFSMWPYC